MGEVRVNVDNSPPVVLPWVLLMSERRLPWAHSPGVGEELRVEGKC